MCWMVEMRRAGDVMRGRSLTVVYLGQLIAEMARVKNVEREEDSDETLLPRALFTQKLKKKKTTKFTKCERCGVLLRRSNLARHRRNKHFETDADEPTLHGSSAPVIREVGAGRLVIKLPAVTKQLENLGLGKKGEEEDEEERELPTTPQSEEELNRQLAKLYAARVPQVTSSAFTYGETRDLLALARDEDKRVELKKVFKAAGLLLYSGEEMELLIQRAREEGRAQAEAEQAPEEPVLGCLPCQADEATLPEGSTAEVALQAALPESGGSITRDELQKNPSSSSQDPGDAPPLVVSSVFREGEPQVVTIYMGDMGLRIQPLRMN